MARRRSGKCWSASMPRTGAAGLPQHAIDELAAHLEDIYNEARRTGSSTTRRFAPLWRARGIAACRRHRARARECRRRGPVGPSGRGWTGLGGDLRFAWRQLRRAPSFAAMAIATLGLGAGAATAIFSVVDAVLLKPLPFREPERLVAIWEATPRRPCRKSGCRR